MKVIFDASRRSTISFTNIDFTAGMGYLQSEDRKRMSYFKYREAEARKKKTKKAEEKKATEEHKARRNAGADDRFNAAHMLREHRTFKQKVEDVIMTVVNHVGGAEEVIIDLDLTFADFDERSLVNFKAHLDVSLTFSSIGRPALLSRLECLLTRAEVSRCTRVR